VGNFIDIAPDVDKKNIRFSFTKNGERVQQGNSGDMIFSFDSIVAHVSKYFSLNIGDLIFTGTPSGVGECVVGDVLEAFLEEASLLKLEVK
jgi:2-keto-4-pentenoate hydratase/2-oxohepta-3-ene-1,7-dioic acid hydratase in catechol pathway